MINILDKQIADKIAAGEVIERPVSIIKELIENSIDAGADSIVVEIKKGGKSYIRVTDNGCGISEEDVEKAFMRHATSKISSVSDLDSIGTLGFRGEALASVAAVTRTELLTKRKEDKVGTRLINNENVLFATAGDGNRLNVISRVFPNIDTNNLVWVKYKDNGMTLEGYISTPALSRTGRNGQIFFVNGRIVNSKVIERGVSSGYKERLFEGRYPITFLFLDVNSSELDVNIHPNKRAVRFDDEKVIEDFIAAAVKNALGTKEAVVRAANIFRDASVFDSNSSMVKEPAGSSKTFQQNEQIDFKNITSTSFSDDEDIPHIKKVLQFEPIETPPQDEFLEDETEIQNFKENIEIPAPAIRPFDFDSLTVTGVIFNTYITAVDDDNFYLFDQHAAHERVFYEKLVGEYDREEKITQPILLPILIDVPASLEEYEERWLTPLREMGFVVENFGQGSYRISEIPTFMSLSEAEDFVKDFVDNIDGKQDLRNLSLIHI